MNTQDTNRKLPMRVKLGYSVASVAPTIQMLIQMYFLLYFYVNIVGLSGGVAGTIILIARVWDFINDPLMGSLVEKSNKPGGTCLWWMKRALIPIAIFMVLCYSAPNLSYTMKVVWAAATFICLGMSQTAYSIPMNALQPKLTTDRTEKVKLGTYGGVASSILNAIVPAVTMPLVAMLSTSNPATAFTKLAAIYACVYLLMGFLGILGCRGYEINDYDKEKGENAPAPTVKEMFAALVQNKVSGVVFLIQVVKMLFSSLQGSMLLYFCTYNLGNANIMSVTTSVGVIFTIGATLLMVPLHKKLGNAGVGVLGAAIDTVTMLILVIIHVSNPKIYIAGVLIAVAGASLATNILSQCLMDSLDYGEWKTGRKNTAVVMSAYGIGTKIGLAFGGSIAAYVIGLIGFDPNAATQPENIVNIFFHMTITSEAVIYGIMLVLFLYLTKIEKKLPMMRAEIAARKEKQVQ